MVSYAVVQQAVVHTGSSTSPWKTGAPSVPQKPYAVHLPETSLVPEHFGGA